MCCWVQCERAEPSPARLTVFSPNTLPPLISFGGETGAALPTPHLNIDKPWQGVFVTSCNHERSFVHQKLATFEFDSNRLFAVACYVPIDRSGALPTDGSTVGHGRLLHSQQSRCFEETRCHLCTIYQVGALPPRFARLWCINKYARNWRLSGFSGLTESGFRGSLRAFSTGVSKCPSTATFRF